MPAQLNAAITACELFKLMRTKWLTRAQIAASIGSNRNTTDRWVKEYEAQGILIRRTSPAERDGGYPAAEFALSKQWGGVADV